MLFCCFFFFCFCFCYCCYYYCAESQPIIGALIVYMYVLCCMCVCVCVLLFLSACEAPARQSHASISMRIPYATNVVCRCWRVALCFVVVASYTSVFIADPIRQMRFSLRHIQTHFPQQFSINGSGLRIVCERILKHKQIGNTAKCT